MAIQDNSDLQPSKKFIPSQPDAYKNFVFDLKTIHRPSVVLVGVENNTVPVFLLPRTRVWLTVNGGGSEFSYLFTGDLETENKHLLSFFKKFGWVSHKTKEDVWFDGPDVSFSGKLFEKYSTLPDSSKVDYTLTIREEMLAMANDLPSDVNEFYANFIQTYAQHASMSYILNLASSEESRLSESGKLSQLINEFKFDEQDRKNPAFIPNLKSYIDCITSKAGAPVSDFNNHFTYISEQVNNLPKPLKEDYMTFIMSEHLAPSTVQGLEPVLMPFIQSLSSLEKMAEILNEYEEAKAGADGMKAPAFSLTSSNGANISLEDLKGQNVYLAFWSSTCRPCMEGMVKSRDNKRLLASDDVQFVYISTDRTKSTWLANKYVRRSGAKDIHLWSGLSAVDIKEYNAIALPTYYFIDKEGNFLTNFPKSWEPEFVDFVKKLD